MLVNWFLRAYNGWQVIVGNGGRATVLHALRCLPYCAREVMSALIIAALRNEKQLHGNLKFTAIELGHLASRSGHARVSYDTLARKTGYHKRTIIRHVHRLLAMGILVKQMVRLTLTRFAVNSYRFLTAPDPLHKRSSDRLAPALPKEREKIPHAPEEEKNLAAKRANFLRTIALGDNFMEVCYGERRL